MVTPNPCLKSQKEKKDKETQSALVSPSRLASKHTNLHQHTSHIKRKQVTQMRQMFLVCDDSYISPPTIAKTTRLCNTQARPLQYVTQYQGPRQVPTPRFWLTRCISSQKSHHLSQVCRTLTQADAHGGIFKIPGQAYESPPETQHPYHIMKSD